MTEEQRGPVTPDEHNSGRRTACLLEIDGDPNMRCNMDRGHDGVCQYSGPDGGPLKRVIRRELKYCALVELGCGATATLCLFARDDEDATSQVGNSGLKVVGIRRTLFGPPVWPNDTVWA